MLNTCLKSEVCLQEDKNRSTKFHTIERERERDYKFGMLENYLMFQTMSEQIVFKVPV